MVVRRAGSRQELLGDVDPFASAIAIFVGVVMAAAIYAGSRGLRNFDAALIPDYEKTLG